jgi:lantibiotic modifying enzyme
MLQQLAAATGDDTRLRRGLRLLHAELDRAGVPDAEALSFPVNDVDKRKMPYVFAGTAGIVLAASRIQAATRDERLTEAMPRLLRGLDLKFTAFPGLCQGLSGLGLALAEHARLAADGRSRERALDVAGGLFKHAVPHASGTRFLGDRSLRLSAELWSGSAGILLFLAQLLDPREDPFFTVDGLANGARPRTPTERTDR